MINETLEGILRHLLAKNPGLDGHVGERGFPGHPGWRELWFRRGHDLWRLLVKPNQSLAFDYWDRSRPRFEPDFRSCLSLASARPDAAGWLRAVLGGFELRL